MINLKEIKALVQKHNMNVVPKLDKLKSYYDGNHDILLKNKRNDGSEPTKIVNNYPKYITTQSTGYFIGNPITYSSPSSDFEEVNSIFKHNYESSHNSELATMASIYGTAFELNYIDEVGAYNFVAVDPRNIIVNYNNSIKPSIETAIILAHSVTLDEKYKLNISVYDNELVEEYECISDEARDLYSEDANYTLIDSRQHNMGKCPIIEYKNNLDRKGDFEDVVSLIDAYNDATSSSVDDLKDFTDAFLCLINMGMISEEEVRKLKDSKVLAFDENGRAEWLTKNVNDTYSTNIKDRLKKDIHKFSFTVDLTDEAFAGNLSGVAIKFKFQSLEQLRQEKEHSFNKGIRKRLELIEIYLAKYNKALDILDIDVQFQDNLPVNLVETLNSLHGATGFLSHKTLLTQVPFVQDVEAELDAINKEKEEKANIYNFSNMDFNSKKMAREEANTEPEKEVGADINDN